MILAFHPDTNYAQLIGLLGAMWDDLLFVLCVPSLNPFGTDEMDAVRESHALGQVPARRPTKLARAPFDELGEAFHKVVSPRQTN